MDFFIQYFTQQSLGVSLGVNFRVKLGVALALFSLVPFPAFSATIDSPFFIGNIAFILGVSAPVAFITFFYQPKKLVKMSWLYVLIASLVGMIYFTSEIQQHEKTFTLICAIVFLSALYFYWISEKTKTLFNIAMISNAIIFILTAVYITVICLYPNDNGYIMWVVVSGILLVLMAVRIKYASSQWSHFLYKILLQWGPSFIFSCCVFLWIQNQLRAEWLIASAAIGYTAAIFMCCRNIITEHITQHKSLPTPLRHSTKPANDTATNLPSQQEALQKANAMIKQHAQDKFAIITFKPVNFTQVNKILGHHNSDILLLQLAYCLQKSVEENTALVNFNSHQHPIRIARLQGLNFLIVLHITNNDYSERIPVEQLCQELMTAVPDAMSFKSFSLNFELVFGVSFLGEHGNSLSQVISHAEDALLAAENNQIPLNYFNKDEVMYTEIHLLKMERLKQDIVDDNLHWYVQPQMCLRDRQLVGFELLVQWFNDSATPTQLKDFIDTAEHSGEIYLLTKQMITRAFKLILKLQRVSNYETVSIKLLSQYLLEPDLVTFIEQQIAKYNVPAKYLVIELPEHVVLAASERAKIIIDELKLLNVKIGISDFSGSYESLRYIRKMAVHQVKVDCKYIGDQQEDSENAIATALVDLTQKMGLPLIGTSINSKKTEQAFTLIGGELAQGSIIDKGVPIDNIDTWVTTWDELYNPV